MLTFNNDPQQTFNQAFTIILFFYLSGDIAFRFLNYVNSLPDHDSDTEYDISVPQGIASDISMNSDTEDMEYDSYTPKSSHVTVCDINQSMLEVGKSRALEAGHYTGMYFYYVSF